MDISKEISKIPFWHQQIDLGHGFITPGAQDTNSLLRQICLPEDLSGMRVLDLGARDGYFSFECERRGASEVIALDYVPADQTGFEICKKVLNSNVVYVNSNVYSIDKSSMNIVFVAPIWVDVIFRKRQHKIGSLAAHEDHVVITP